MRCRRPASPSVPSILFRAAGFEPLRQTDVPATEAAIATLANADKGKDLTFITQDFGRLELPQGTDLDVSIGSDASGDRVLQIAFRETDIIDLCLRFTRFCTDRGNPIRRATASIADGRIKISGEALLGLVGIWQAIEIHMAVDEVDFLKIDSISLGGLRYKLPANALGDHIRDALSTMTYVLRQLQAESNGEVHSFAHFDLSDNRLVATFRSG